VLLGCFFGFAWMMFLFSCFLNGNFNASGKLIVFVAVGIWSVLGYAFFRFIPAAFQQQQQSDVVKFIEMHLLS
jgi:hypothetical protein